MVSLLTPAGRAQMDRMPVFVLTGFLAADEFGPSNCDAEPKANVAQGTAAVDRGVTSGNGTANKQASRLQRRR